MTTPAPSRTRRIPIGDTTIKGGIKDRPEKFQGIKGMSYVVRIMTTPIAYAAGFVENVTDPKKSFQTSSLADIDTAEAAINGDPAALKRAMAVCPLFKNNFKVGIRYVVGLWIAYQLDSKGRKQDVNMFKPWSFAAERYQNLTSQASTLPINPATGKPVDISQVELKLDCTDEKFQKFNMAAFTTKSQMSSTKKEVWEKIKHLFADQADPNSDCEIINDLIEPDPYQHLIVSIKRAQGQSANMGAQEPDTIGGDTIDGEASAAAPRAAAPRAAAAKPAVTAAAPRAARPAAAAAPVVEEAPDETLSDVLGDETLDLD